MPIASRLTSTGSLLVNGSFDENTSISPSVFRTNATTVYAGTLDEVSLATGAISFNGSSTYLTVPYSSNFDFGSGDFTIEFWMYTSSSGNSLRGLMAFSHNASNYAQALWYFPTASTISFWCSSNGTSWDVANNVATGTFALNTWYHVAVSRSGSSIRLFFNGVLQNTITFAGTLTGTYDRNWIGDTASNGYYNGLLSNIRVVKGTAVYTANFTPPQTILPAITNTQLLLNATDSANFIKDNSTNNYSVTNNGTATFIANGPFNRGSTATAQRQLPDGTLEVYNQFDEFTGAPIVDSSLQLWLDAGQISSYPGSGTTWTDLSGNSRTGTLTNGPTYSDTNGGSIIFDGTDDFVQCSGSLTVTAATFVAWIRRNGATDQYDGILFSRGTSVTGMNFYLSNQLGYHWNGNGNTYTWSSGLSVPDLTWCMVAVSVTSTAATAYLCQSSGITSAINTVNHSSSLLDDIKIAQDEAIGNRFFNGRIATAMIYNRALSADEIATNFNALRGRYGI
jgi:hypothetical protein